MKTILLINPMQESKSMHSLGALPHTPPFPLQEKGIGVKCMFKAQFFKANSLKEKNRAINLII